MEFGDDILAQVGILLLGVCGFLIARHIYRHKNNNQSPLVCPIKFDCHAVTNSDYSKLFGIPLEMLGMTYYGLISLAYLFLIFLPSIPSGLLLNLTLILILLSSIAFLFSLYLIGVQIFILKKGCSWCIVSAFICLLIFILTMINYDFSFITEIFIK